MFASQLYADIPDLTDTELRIILVCIGTTSVMTMDDVQQRTGRGRQVYDAVKVLENKGWLIRHRVASIGAQTWRWEMTRYAALVAPTPSDPVVVPALPPADTTDKPAPKPKAKKAKTPKEKPLTAQHHPAVAAYVEIVHRRPTHAVAEQIAQTITDIDKWRDTVKQYLLRGWNPMNVAGMIQVYRGEIKLTKKGRYSTEIPHQSPDVAKAAFEEYLRQEGETYDG